MQAGLAPHWGHPDFITLNALGRRYDIFNHSRRSFLKELAAALLMSKGEKSEV
jgi:hypothetical protein